MTVMLLHGVPETPDLWDPLRAALGRDDVVAPRLPGFGSPLPDGFDATMGTYAAWLATELAAHDDVHLVGHDWGGLLAMRVLADRPANVRSWVLDGGDLADDFRWHDTALTFQTPGEGEALVEAIVDNTLAERTAILAGLGVPEAHAEAMAAPMDRTMGEAILALYRSATAIGTEWGPGIDRFTGPGLIVESGQDPFRSPGRARRLAERTGATVAELPDAGHWWMLEDPEGVAARLEAFWAGAAS